ncbi:hypothetical protein FMUND_620 [Fusarium mundagurra]|uniref:Uncharacterized protein n=1 Tax=Fusarium mundagurra TaxID=1567541 RepID=A0A8H5Z4H9_9HYPO|nr:hypothetical protein FMUND_620 [Fusarium mundagurra]
MLVPSPPDNKISYEAKITVESESPMELYDLLGLPKDDSTWHTYVVDPDQFSSFLWDLPSVHVVGYLSDGNCVVTVASSIHQRFYDAYVQHLSPEEPAGEDIFTDVLIPTNLQIVKYGFKTAKEKTRSDVLRKAVRGVTCPGRLALYHYYKTIIHNDYNLLPIEWALLGNDLRLSKPEVRNKFTLLSVLLELHFVQDMNSDAISQVLEGKRPDRWGEYLATKENLAIAKVVENANDQMHEISLLRGLLGLAGHQKSVYYYQYDQDRSIDDSWLILGRALRCIFYPEHESEAPGRMRIPRPLGADDVQQRLTQSGYSATEISELLANLTIFLPIRLPVPYIETLPATLVNRLRRRVVVDAIHEICDTYVRHHDLNREENDTMLLLLYIAKNGLESEVTRTWMTSEEGQIVYGQILTRIREQAQSLEQFTLSVLEPVYGRNLRDFSFLLHGDKRVNRRRVLEMVASYTQNVLTGRSAGAAQAVTLSVMPLSAHWSKASTNSPVTHINQEWSSY